MFTFEIFTRVVKVAKRSPGPATLPVHSLRQSDADRVYNDQSTLRVDGHRLHRQMQSLLVDVGWLPGADHRPGYITRGLTPAPDPEAPHLPIREHRLHRHAAHQSPDAEG